MTRVRSAVVAAIAVAGLAASQASAQTSQFGVRGLGLPMRPYSTHALGVGGGLALFDPKSGLSPAPLGLLRGLEAGGGSLTNWRTSRAPAGEGTGRDTRYPNAQAAGPVLTGALGEVRLVAGISLNGYSDRNFLITSQDSIVVRDEKLAVNDTIHSLGGISDIRVAAAWNPGPAVIVGAGFHVVTGSARVRSVRVIDSDHYQPASQLSEISYLGYGLSGGVQLQPTPQVALAAMARVDAPVRIERDTVQVGEIALPLTLAGGVQFAPHARLRASGHVVHRGWQRASDDIVALGGLGSRNTLELAGGIEWASSGTNVTRWPLRLGVRSATLPFPLEAGGTGREVGVSIGTGAMFGLGGRGGLDLALERVWRREGTGYREQGFLLSIGLTVRPTN